MADLGEGVVFTASEESDAVGKDLSGVVTEALHEVVLELPRFEDVELDVERLGRTERNVVVEESDHSIGGQFVNTPSFTWQKWEGPVRTA